MMSSSICRVFLKISLSYFELCPYNACMEKIKLSSADRSFFDLVSEAAFANPFGGRRIELDREILGGRKGGTWPQIVSDVSRHVRDRISVFDRDEPVRIQAFDGDCRPIIETVFLFDIFHRYAQAFDALIDQQTKAGSEPVDVTFAQAALNDFERRGFSRELAKRYFSLFFQLRRAFHFIDRGLLGNCPSMKQLRENLWNHIFTCDIQLYEQTLWNRMEDFSTLLLGPTGCGKGAAAAAIGRSGFIPFDVPANCFVKSFTDTFVEVNLTQYAETLLESELFGHTKGSFTGAVCAHEGVLSLCGKHGSVFLDEIGDISPAIQVKLLKVLEERVFAPVGSHSQRPFHGRVIGATHRSLDSLREQARFRDDFYYRLCSDCIVLPGLQQRIQESDQELDILTQHVVERITGQRNEALCRTVREVIDRRLGPNYHWPGNVRELAQCVRRVIIKRDYQGQVPTSDSGPADELSDHIRNGTIRAEDLLSRYCKTLYNRFGTYEEVARRADLDRRTAKRYVHL